MLYLELFAGGGGAALGLRRAGWTALAHVEWDVHACETLAANGFHPWCGDVRDFLAGTPRQYEAIWASPPCQPFSQSGKQQGHDDPRDGWPLVFAAVRKFRPRWLLCEQVPKGVTPHVLEELSKLFPAVTHVVVDAADYGLPQHRKRALLACGPVGVRVPEPTHGPGRALPWRTMGEALNGTFIGGGSNPNKSYPYRTLRDLTHEPSTTIAAQVGGNSLPYRTGFYARAEQVGAKGRSSAHPAPTVSTVANLYFYPEDPGTRPGKVYPIDGSHGRAGTEPQRLDRPSPTVMTTEVKGTRAHAPDWTFNGGPDRASDALFLATGGRRITPEEAACLQGFPPDYRFIGNKTQVYAQIGNAIPPMLAEMWARAVEEADHGHHG